MPEATVLQRRAAVAPGSARSFAEAEAQARRLAESEVSAAQAAVVLPAAQDAAGVGGGGGGAGGPRAAGARGGARGARGRAGRAGVEVARQPGGRDAAAVLGRAGRGAQALPWAAVFLPCPLRVRLAP